MITQNSDDYFMSQMLDAAAWKALSKEFYWSEALLEKYRDTVDWSEVSGNNGILWTTSMLEKFKTEIDWKELSGTPHKSIFSSIVIERFKDYWDWSELSRGFHDAWTQEILDQFADYWDWGAIINNSMLDMNIDFFNRYKDYIPITTFQDSRLWDKIVEDRKYKLAQEIAIQ